MAPCRLPGGPPEPAACAPHGEGASPAGTGDDRTAAEDGSPPAAGRPGVAHPDTGPAPAADGGAAGPVPPGAGATEGAAERALLRAARAGDAAAFGDLVAPLMQPAFQFAVRLLGDRALAEDVTQDALLRAFTALRSFRGEARFRTWVFRIVHNACTDALRRQARRPRLQPAHAEDAAAEDGVAEIADPSPGPEEAALERGGRREILQALATLSPEFRAVVVLRDVHGLAYEEVAAVTGQSLGTVKSRLHRARAALRAVLAPAEAAAEARRGARVPAGLPPGGGTPGGPGHAAGWRPDGGGPGGLPARGVGRGSAGAAGTGAGRAGEPAAVGGVQRDGTPAERRDRRGVP